MPAEEGLCLIDQHLAHVNILYYNFMQRMEQQAACSQQLLFPDTIDLSKDDAVLLGEMQSDLRSLGFDVEAIGPESFIINGVPAELTNQNGVRALMDILSEIKSSGVNSKQHWRGRISSALAADVAIPYGRTLNTDEMKDLVERLVALPVPALTPRGEHVMAMLTFKEIEMLFK